MYPDRDIFEPDCTQLGIHYSTWSKHGGKWGDRRRENRCQFSFSWMNSDHKITKIVRALWLAEKRVCMRVCKHGCDVKMFCFSRANHASTNLKKVLSWKTRQVYFIYPFLRRLKLEKSLETCCVNFCRLTGHFKREKPVFWKASFLQNKDWLRVQASCTRLRDW